MSNGSYLSTKTGDSGTTQLAGTRIPKYDPAVRAMAFMDSCQSAIALAGAASSDRVVIDFCNEVNRQQWAINGLFHSKKMNVEPEMTEKYVQYLDDFLANLPTPKVNFFIGPHPKNVFLMGARTTVRVAETFLTEIETCPGIHKYFNRLSDCLHALALHVLTEDELMESNVHFTGGRTIKSRESRFGPKEYPIWVVYLVIGIFAALVYYIKQ